MGIGIDWAEALYFLLCLLVVAELDDRYRGRR